MRTKTKILFFINSLTGGGAEKVLVNLANSMDKTRFDITVQTLFDVGVNKQFLNKDVAYRRVFKRVIRGNVHLFKLFSPVFLFRQMIKGQFDVIASFFEGATTRIVAGCVRPNVKLVQWIHNEFPDRKKISRCYRSDAECSELQQRYDATFYVSQTVKEIYQRSFPELVKNNLVLYNVVDSEQIITKGGESVEDERFQKRDSEIRLVSVGRLVPQKGFDRLLRVVEKLYFNDRVNMRLFILGSGELESKLRAQVTQAKLENVVVFLGYQENPYKYVRNADLFVCSSLHEGFSTAVTESLILGTPVVTTECSGMRELLGDDEFGIITPNDEDALYRGVKDMLSTPGKLERYARKAQERGYAFDKEATTKAVEETFIRLVNSQ